jgi:hypothetical protein
VFTTRWAMSYLRGALTREEVARLTGDQAAPVDAATPSSTSAPEPADDESPVAPPVPGSVAVHYLDPGAPWAGDVGAKPGSLRLEPALVARLHLTFDDHHAGLNHTEEWEAIFSPLDQRFDPTSRHDVDYDDRDFRSRPPDGARYVLGDAPITDASFYRDAARDLKEHAYRQRQVTLLRNSELKLYSRPGEAREEFAERCRRAAADRADEAVAALKDRYGKRIDRVRDAIAKAESRVRELEVDVSARKQQEILAGAGKLISMFLGGRASATALSGAASRRSMTRRTEERLRTASERHADREAEIRELEDELAEEVVKIVDDWEARAERIEPLEVGLEKNDIVVDEVGLLWIPR